MNQLTKIKIQLKKSYFIYQKNQWYIFLNLVVATFFGKSGGMTSSSAYTVPTNDECLLL